MQESGDRHYNGRYHIKEQHYKTAAEWLEHLALAALASVVFQKLLSGASVGDPVVIIGSICALIIYGAAISLLLRS